MAINTSNSNFVNINSLPQSQEAINSDLLILQTENGTQTITFENFNVVKTTVAGDTVLPGGLTGTNCYFSDLSAQEISCSQFYVDSTAGDEINNLYCNRFTVKGGIVTSGSFVNQSSPDYIYLVNTYIPAITTYQNSIYKRVVEKNGVANFQTGDRITTITLNNFFVDYPDITTINSVKRPDLFTLVVGSSASSVPFVPYSSIQKVGNNFQFSIDIGNPLPAFISSFDVYWRFLYLYTSTAI